MEETETVKEEVATVNKNSSPEAMEDKEKKEEIKTDNSESKPSELNEINDDKKEGEALDLNFLLDIPLDVTVELGKTKMIINDLLQLGQGSVLELPKLVGEPLEVLVNNKLVARGEPVMVNEKFGIRLTDIISPFERLERLK